MDPNNNQPSDPNTPSSNNPVVSGITPPPVPSSPSGIEPSNYTNPSQASLPASPFLNQPPVPEPDLDLNLAANPSLAPQSDSPQPFEPSQFNFSIPSEPENPPAAPDSGLATPVDLTSTAFPIPEPVSSFTSPAIGQASPSLEQPIHEPIETPSVQPPQEMTLPEVAPTDFSHLVGSPAAENIPPAPPVPESLTVPPPPVQQPQSAPMTTNSSSGMPKWILIVGAAVLLLIVSGASAYFILGVGKASPSTSLPIEESSLTNQPVQVLPVTPTPLEIQESSLKEATPSPEASSSTTPSALELLKKRQTQ